MAEKSKKSKGNVEPLINQQKAKKNDDRYFNLLVDDVPYRVEVEPFYFNDQVRYYVSVNAGPRDVFAWDSDVELFRAIDDDAAILSVALEKAISAKLLEQQLG